MASLIDQARQRIQEAKLLLLEYEVVLTQSQEDPTKNSLYTRLGNCIWTVESTLTALVNLQNSSPDDLYAALGRLSLAIQAVELDIQKRHTP
jgi:hypothetical protein